MALLNFVLHSIFKSWLLSTSLFALLFLAYQAVQTFRTWFRLSHIKGPLSASLSKWWMIRAVSGGRMHLDFWEVCQKYGPISRIGPNQLVCSDAEVWKRILAVRSPYQRSDWYIGMRFDPSRENVESERNDEKHNALRAKMAAGYSGKEVSNLENVIDQNIAALVKLVKKYVTQGSEFKPMDFGRKAQYFTLDVISSVAYGKAFGHLIEDGDVYDYIRTTEEVLPAVMMVTVLPWMNWLLQTQILKAILPSDKDPIGFGKIMRITKQVVGERFGLGKKTSSQDMLDSFIRHGLTQEEAESETMLQVIAGSDTTATAIRVIFLYLITNPRVLCKLRTEIANASISNPITDAEARELPYLQAIIKEGLRIWPPVVGLMSKEVPAGGDEINGLFIPGGTQIGYCAFGIFRDRKIWGEDADSFRPERFLDGSPEKIKYLEQTLYLVFASGKWQCLGQNVALIELNKVFVELLRNFDFAVVDPTTPWKSVCNGIFSQSKMWISVSSRKEL